VTQVRELLGQTKPLAYTTVMTLLDRLSRKGAVSRRKQGRAFIYSPIASREAIRSAAVSELVELLFDGSPEQLAHYLGTQPKPSHAPAPAEPDAIDTVLL